MPGNACTQTYAITRTCACTVTNRVYVHMQLNMQTTGAQLLGTYACMCGGGHLPEHARNTHLSAMDSGVNPEASMAFWYLSSPTSLVPSIRDISLSWINLHAE